MNCYYIKAEDDALFNNTSKILTSVLSPLKSMLNFEVDRLSLQQLEYEIDSTDYHANYNFFAIGYFGHPNLPYSNIQFKQATDLILSYFQEKDHPFIHDTFKKIHNWFYYIFLHT